MSGASAEQFSPGLEGVIASETAIANIEGKDGAGGLEYRGYRIEDLAGHVSYEETAFLLLHGDLPDRGQLREFDARLRAARAIPEPLIELFERIPAPHPSHGRAPQLGERAGPFRPGCQRAADRPRRQRTQGRADGGPDGDGGRLSRADRQRPAGDPAPRRSRSRRQFLEHGQRQGPLGRRCARPSTSRWFSTPSTSSTPRPSRRA